MGKNRQPRAPQEVPSAASRAGRGSDGHRAATYPYPTLVPLERFEEAASVLGLCRQERRVVMGRILRYSPSEIADFLKLSPHTVKQYGDSARRRAQCKDCGELVRRVFTLMFRA